MLRQRPNLAPGGVLTFKFSPCADKLPPVKLREFIPFHHLLKDVQLIFYGLRDSRHWFRIQSPCNCDPNSFHLIDHAFQNFFCSEISQSCDPSVSHLSCPQPPPHWSSKTCPSTDAHPSSITACPTLSQWCFNGWSGLSLSSLRCDNKLTFQDLLLPYLIPPNLVGVPRIDWSCQMGGWEIESGCPQEVKFGRLVARTPLGGLWEHLSWCVQPIFKETHDESMCDRVITGYLPFTPFTLSNRNT